MRISDWSSDVCSSDLLIKISGVGPKLALTVLSGVSVEDFWNTIRAGDVARLTKLPGVGRKTAERLVIEMRDKAGAEGETGAGIRLAVEDRKSTRLNSSH